MKKLSVYLLIFLLSLVYTYEGIQSMAKALGYDSSYLWIDNIENSEENTESEGSKEQKEKVNFLEHYYSQSQLSLAQMGAIKAGSHYAINFSSCDYSQTVYSPPEKLA